MEQISAKAVVHVITDAGPHPYFRTLIEAGGLERSSLAVVTVGPAGALQHDMAELGVSTFALGAGSRFTYPAAALRLARLLRELRAQVVQTHLLDGSLVGLAAARLARTPVAIMTAHHSHELPFHGRRLIWPERLCARPLSDHIIAPSQEVARTLSRWTGVPTEKVTVVHHGFDLDRFDPRRADRARVRHELGLADELVFGAIGRSYRLKNYEALLEAFALAFGELHEARLLVVGPGDTAALEELAVTLGIRDRVRFVGPRADIPDVLAAFDVFVHPAIAESFGMVIIEAMAMARPVLSTHVGIAREAIEPGRTGFLSPSPDAETLATALRVALEHRSSWPEIGTAARRRAESFTARSMATRHEQLYASWLEAAEQKHPRRSHADAALPMSKGGAPTILSGADDTARGNTSN